MSINFLQFMKLKTLRKFKNKTLKHNINTNSKSEREILISPIQDDRMNISEKFVHDQKRSHRQTLNIGT